MAQAVVAFFDDDADAAVRALWRRLADIGVPTPSAFAPHLTLGVAGTIPRGTRDALRRDLARLAVPSLRFAALGTFVQSVHQSALMLSAVVDTELLAVHSAVHDVLAGKVHSPSVYYLPGAWVPHCALANGIEPQQVIDGFATLHPVTPLTAKVTALAVIDTRTGTTTPLR